MPSLPNEQPVNAMTVDVEDYFQVSAFEHQVGRQDWGAFDSRVVPNTQRLLEIFAETSISATFFVLGWVGERFPALVQQIQSAGHEIASHGYEHRLVYELTPREFRDDLRRARSALEEVSGVRVRGYRAPSFSITQKSTWALSVLAEEGYQYDASIYPIRHDRYGIPSASRHAHEVQLESGTIWELPGSTVRCCGHNFPIGGGGYFRHLPYEWTRRGIKHVNRVERKPVTFYVHPWEIDPDQPRIATSLLGRIRHYRNLDKTEVRLRRLVKEFRFGRAVDVLSEVSHASVCERPSWSVAKPVAQTGVARAGD